MPKPDLSAARSTSSAPAGGWRHELQLIGYSSANFGKNLVLGGVDLTLLFMLTDLLAIPPAQVGLLMTMVFLGDLIFDILAGAVTGQAMERGVGYRKLIVLGALPCALGYAAIYAFPWAGLRDLWLLGAVLLAFRGAYAIIDVPHNSLLAQVAPDGRSRGRVSGYRTLFSTVSSLASVTLLAPAVMSAAHHGRMGTLAMLGLAGGVLACATLWIAAAASHGDRLPPKHPKKPRAPLALFPKPDGLVAAMVVIGVIIGFAMPMFGRTAIYLTTYAYQRPDLAEPLLLALTLGQFPGALLWTWLVRFADKTWLLMASHGATIAVLLLFMLAGSDKTMLIALTVLLGAAFAGVYMFPWGILADVLDFAEFRHGERREAPMVALVLVTVKASAAASTGAIGWVLARMGYVPGAVQSPAMILAFKIMALGIPMLGSALSLLVLSRMKVGGRAHATVQRALKRRRTAATALPLPPIKQAPRRASPSLLANFIYFSKNNKKRHTASG